jgi:hypothetical protein
VLSKLAYLALFRSIQLLALLARGDTAKDLEILLLRHQLAVLRRHVPRLKFEPTDRALLAVLSGALPRSRWSCFPVKPRRCCAGTAWSLARGRIPVADVFVALGSGRGLAPKSMNDDGAQSRPASTRRTNAALPSE